MLLKWQILICLLRNDWIHPVIKTRSVTQMRSAFSKKMERVLVLVPLLSWKKGKWKIIEKSTFCIGIAWIHSWVFSVGQKNKGYKWNETRRAFGVSWRVCLRSVKVDITLLVSLDCLQHWPFWEWEDDISPCKKRIFTYHQPKVSKDIRYPL